MDFWNDYIVIGIMAVCLCVGYIIRNLIPSDKINKFIPLIMGILGIFLNFWFNNWNFTPSILLGGLISGLASTGGYETVKNLIKNFNNKN